jgi:hypothetical protein
MVITLPTTKNNRTKNLVRFLRTFFLFPERTKNARVQTFFIRLILTLCTRLYTTHQNHRSTVLKNYQISLSWKSKIDQKLSIYNPYYSKSFHEFLINQKDQKSPALQTGVTPRFIYDFVKPDYKCIPHCLEFMNSGEFAFSVHMHLLSLAIEYAHKVFRLLRLGLLKIFGFWWFSVNRLLRFW